VRKLILSLYLLHLICVITQAQDIEEIRKKYPGENAVVLNQSMHYKIEVRNGQPYVESRNSEKLLYLNTDLSYLGRYSFHHSTFHEVREYSAYTQTTANKKIKVTDFQTNNSSSGSVFYDDAKETRFDFPSLSPGATGNLEVSVVHNKPYLLSPYYFSRRVPVVRTELKITASKDISIKYILKGIDTTVIRVKVNQKRDETVYTFYAENLNGLRMYGDAPDESWFLPHVIFYIDNYRNDKGEAVKYLSSVDDLYKLNTSFIRNVNKVPGSEMKLLVDSLSMGTPDKVEKTKRIYQWVQKHIKYIAFEDGMGGFIPRDANIVLHRRYGDCKDMASLLTMMLNTAGVPAYFTWIGTRDIAYSYHETPLPIVDNHMICTAYPGGKMIFLDGTDPNCVFGSVPPGIQDKEAMVALSADEYKIVKLPVPGMEENGQFDSTFIEISKVGLEGRIVRDLKGYYATNMHSYLSSIQERDLKEQIKKMFSRGSNKFQLNDFSIGSKTDMNRISLSGDFLLSDYAKKAGDEWFLNMNLLRIYQGEEIDYPKRTMPVKKEFLYKNRYVVDLKISEGYSATFIPKGKSFRNNVWGFDLTYRVEKDHIIYTLELDGNHLMINADQFEEWNKVLGQLTPLYKEIVILSKK
jgi:transglutaminase-like putative cysteine protease